MVDSGMRKEDIVSYNVRLNRGFPLLTGQMADDRAPAGGLDTQIIALNGKTMRLIECDPVFHSIPKGFKACRRIFLKVFSEKRKLLNPVHLACQNYDMIILYSTKEEGGWGEDVAMPTHRCAILRV